MVQSTGRWNLRWCSKPQRVVPCSLETMITYSTVLPQHYRIQTIPNSCRTLRRTPKSLHRPSTAFPPRRRSLPRTFAAGISVPFLRAVRWRRWVGRLGTLVFRRRKCFRPRPRNVESMGVRRYPRRALARTPCKSTGKYKRPLSRRAVGQRTEHRMERNAHNEVDVSRSSGHGRSILLCSNPADDDLMGPDCLPAAVLPPFDRRTFCCHRSPAESDVDTRLGVLLRSVARCVVENRRSAQYCAKVVSSRRSLVGHDPDPITHHDL